MCGGPALNPRLQLLSRAVCRRGRYSAVFSFCCTLPICCHWLSVMVSFRTLRWWYADIRLLPTVSISGSADAYVSMHRRGCGVDAFQSVTAEHCEDPSFSGPQPAAVFISCRIYRSGSVPTTFHQLPLFETLEFTSTAMSLFIFIYKLRTQCHTIIAETVQNSNRHWRRPTQVLKHLRVALKHIT